MGSFGTFDLLNTSWLLLIALGIAYKRDFKVLTYKRSLKKWHITSYCLDFPSFKALWNTMHFHECMGARKALMDCQITLNKHFFACEMTFWQTKRTCILSWIFNMTYKTQNVSSFCVVTVAYGHFYIFNLNQKSSFWQRELKLFFIWTIVLQLLSLPYLHT